MIVNVGVRATPRTTIIVAVREVPSHMLPFTGDKLARFAGEHPGWDSMLAGEVVSRSIDGAFVATNALWR